jgi:hypothetical protein
MKYLILVVFLCLHTTAIFAKKEVELKYPVSAIPATLKENAHVVIRDVNVELNILSLNKVKYKSTIVYTILDDKGAAYAKLVCPYNFLLKVDELSGKLYNDSGRAIREMKEKDVFDFSTFGSSSVFHTDSRIKKFDFGYSKYPFTVAYSIEEILNTTFFLPDWYVQPGIDCAVEHATFTLIYPKDATVRYKEYLMPASLDKKEATDTKGNTTITWNVKDIPAKYEQPFSKSDNYEGPTLVLSPSKFQLLDHEGNMDSWKDLGKFIYELNNGLDALPDDKKAMVKTLCEGTPGTYDKVQKLYHYMQESTRYVAIEYGIAGWQTFDAMNVAQNGYGDCKGLTNYLKALLKEASITSYATLVFAGADDYFKLDESFPSNVFNHVILCVPDGKDTIWVECTSTQLSAGYLGNFTQDRKVLLITEDGGVVCRTPAYNLNKNAIVRKAIMHLDVNAANQKIDLNNQYVGLMQDELSSFVKTESEKKIKDMINSRFAFASYNVDQYKYTPTGNRDVPVMEELAQVSVSGITTKTTKRTFLNLGWMNNPMSSISQTKPRTAPLVLSESYKISDTVVVNLPEGMEIESMPAAINLSFDFGSYDTKFEKNKDQIIFIRNYMQHKGIFTIDDYNNYQKMYSTINAGKNNLNLVFLNKTP